MLVGLLLCLTAYVAGEEYYAGVLKSPKAMLTLFNNFKAEEHQSFPSAENRFRFRVFRKTVKFIASENAQHNGYESGLNFFADLTDEERQQYLGVNMSSFIPPPSSDYDGRIMSDYDGRIMAPAAAPSKKSWVEAGAVTRVKNQGSCGSCWTFGASASLETFYKSTSGVLRAFSEQELLDCTYESTSGKDGCKGGWPSNCFDYAKAGHLASEKDYGYRAKDNKCRNSNYKTALIAMKVTGFVSVPTNEPAFIQALSGGALAVAFQVTNKFSMYKKGIFKDMTCKGRINHAVTAVAYTPVYILVKNSWGGKWGDRGFVKFTRGYDNCGLLTYASHPTVAATSTKDTNSADIATNYDADDENTPTDAPDPNPNCFDQAGDCTKAYCQWEDFSKRMCAKTCNHCHNEEDGTEDSGDCPPGTVRCKDGQCKHVHMC